MGVQLFFGLATCPDNESSKLEMTKASTEHTSFSPTTTFFPLLGGARSTQSQFREGTGTAVDDGVPQRSPGVRVGGSPSGPSGASAKGREHIVGSFTAASVCVSRVKKRSLRRAIRRAQQGKDATYKRRRALHNPACPYVPADAQPPRAQPRLHVLSWNCSGLTQLLFEEFKLFLKQRPEIQVISLQEAHRAFQSEWVAEGWTFVHSAASKPHQGGVLLGFRDGFCDRGSLRWQELHPGRLLHARCFSRDQHMDFICLYQHALPFESDALTATMGKRKQLWTKLDVLLRSMPVRSSVVITGDFNSNLNTVVPCIGYGVVQNKAKAEVVEERKWLSGMLASHQMTALTPGPRSFVPTHTPLGGLRLTGFLLGLLLQIMLPRPVSLRSPQ